MNYNSKCRSEAPLSSPSPREGRAGRGVSFAPHPTPSSVIRQPETERLSFKSSSIHGLGGFAKQDIPRGARIVEYLGEKISKRESLTRCEQNNEYIFTLDENEDLDGNVTWNPARLLNHSCAPNCDAELQDGRIWIVARRAIRTGEEITFNYGYDLVDYQEYPCNCHTPMCVGFIVAEEFFDHVRRSEWS